MRSRIQLLTLFMLAGFACWSVPSAVRGSEKTEAPAAEGHDATEPAEESGAEEGSHGAGAPAAEAATGDEPPPSAGSDDRTIDGFKLGNQLNNRFDLTVLKNRERVTPFRLELSGISQPIRSTPKRYVQLSCVVEFGNESGIVELRENLYPVQEDIRSQLHLMTFKDLMHDEGKRAVKSAVAEVINRRMLTARVRRVYITEFRITDKSPI